MRAKPLILGKIIIITIIIIKRRTKLRTKSGMLNIAKCLG